MRPRLGIRDALHLTLISAVAISACHFFNQEWLNPHGGRSVSFYARTIVVSFTFMTLVVATLDQNLRANWSVCPGRISIVAAVIVMLMIIAGRLDTVWSLEYKGYALGQEPNPVAMVIDHLFVNTILNRVEYAPAYGIVVAWFLLWFRGDAKFSFDWICVIGILTGLYWTTFGFARAVLGW